MDEPTILRALSYEARTILLDTVWRTTYTTATLCGITTATAHAIADTTADDAAQHWDDVTRKATEDTRRLDRRRRKAAKVHEKNHQLHKQTHQTQHKPSQHHNR
jgi:hypothetical protein